MVRHARCEILVFEVGGRRFGVPASRIQELVRAVTIVPLPLAPPIVEGVVNLRGQVVPVLDIRARLGMAPRGTVTEDHLIVGWIRGRLSAIRVDRALELMTVSEGTSAIPLDAPTAEQDGQDRVARLADGLAPIIDLGSLLTESESDALGAVLRGVREAEEAAR